MFSVWRSRDGANAVEIGHRVAVVNHTVTGEFGMKLLADNLRERFPQTTVHHLPQKCMYRLIKGYHRE